MRGALRLAIIGAAFVAVSFHWPSQHSPIAAFAEESAAAPDAAGEASQAPEAGAASPLNTEADALALCEAFMQRIVAGRFEEAFALIRAYFPVPEARVTKIETETKQQLGMAELQFGRALDHAFISGQQVNGAVLRYRFLQRFDRDAIFWEFVFYKPQGSWLVNALGFDDEIRDLFK